MLPVRPQEPHDPDQQQSADNSVELVKVLAHGAPVLSQLHADICQHEAPGPRTQEGVDVKLTTRHSCDSGGECNKGSNDRQQPSDKDRGLSPARKEAIRPIEFAATQENI